MRERQIIFSRPMVQAILEGRKTVTRRIIPRGSRALIAAMHGSPARSPYGEAGDRLWVKETWRVGAAWDTDAPAQIGLYLDDARAAMVGGTTPILYLADGAIRHSHTDATTWGRYRHARFMPRWASRLLLDVVDVRVERLHDITDEDAMREGIDEDEAANAAYAECAECQRRDFDECVHYSGPRDGFRALWESINGPGSWERNDWVWRIAFRRVEVSRG